MPGSGQLDTRISVLRDTLQDGSGGVTRAGEFSPAFSRFAQVIRNPKPEERVAGAIVDRQPAEFIVRNDPDTRTITAEDRLTIHAEAGEYEILSIVPASRQWPFIRVKTERIP